MYLADEHKIWVCKGEDKICMLPKMANRHGLIAGATGTGKTVTLKVLAESFSEMGVPVFLADIKGDVSGMCKAGESSEGFQKRLHKLGIENFEFKGFPVRFFDVFGFQYAICHIAPVSRLPCACAHKYTLNYNTAYLIKQ